MIRVEPGTLSDLPAAALFLSRSRLVRKKCPKWFVPSCSSMFSSVNFCSGTMTPELLMRMSIVSRREVTCEAAFWMDFWDARSSSKNSTETSGEDSLILSITYATFSLVRDARTNLDGL